MEKNALPSDSQYSLAVCTESPIRRSEVKLPKNAVELIMAAMAACKTTTPTLTEIATYIHGNVAAYRHQELCNLIRMVGHHLCKNNPAYFLPVLSPGGGHIYNSPMARWAINRQAVVVGEDGSFIRRRHRFHTGRYSPHNSAGGAATRSASLVVASTRASNGPCSPPYQTGSTGAPTDFFSAATSYSPTTFLPGGSTRSMFGTMTCGLSSGHEQVGAEVHGLSLPSTIGAGKKPIAQSHASVACQLSSC